MKKSYNKAFTLVELLAVIVILAIILVIAVPKIMDVINSSKKSTLETSVKMIASAAEKTKMQNTLLGKNNDVIKCEDVAKLSSSDYDLDNCTITFDGSTAKVTVKGKGKFEGLSVCGGTKNSATAQKEMCATDGKYFTYEFVDESETIKITGYNTVGGRDVVIPSVIDGYIVVSIGSNAFVDTNNYDHSGLDIKSVVIPDTVEEIEYQAFMYNKLSSIMIPSNVTSIGNWAFGYNNITKVELSNPNIEIGFCAFGEKENIAEHNLPSNYECNYPQ